MFDIIKQHPKAVLWAFIVHVVFIIILGVSFHFSDTPSSVPASEKIIKAVTINEKTIKKELAKLKKQERRKKWHQKLAEKKVREARLKRKKEEKRLAELKRKRIAQQKADKKRQADVEKKRKQEERRLAELEQQRRQQEAQKLQQEQARREEELKKQLEAEQQRLAAERKSRNQSIIAKYKAMIESEVRRHWIVPASAKFGMVCTVRVQLIPSGEVISVQLIKSSGNNVYDRSVQNAVKKASPLPLPPAEYELFNKFRVLNLNFPYKADKQ